MEIYGCIYIYIYMFLWGTYNGEKIGDFFGDPPAVCPSSGWIGPKCGMNHWKKKKSLDRWPN